MARVNNDGLDCSIISPNEPHPVIAHPMALAANAPPFGVRREGAGGYSAGRWGGERATCTLPFGGGEGELPRDKACV